MYIAGQCKPLRDIRPCTARSERILVEAGCGVIFFQLPAGNSFFPSNANAFNAACAETRNQAGLTSAKLWGRNARQIK